MHTNKVFVLFLALCISSLVFAVDAHAASDVNLAVIPNSWHLTYGSGPQIIFLDYTVVRTAGKPSIRLEPHTAKDVNYARECDGTWYSVKPGDHIVAKCWIKIADNGDRYAYSGARIGIDLYGGASYLLWGIDDGAYINPHDPNGVAESQFYVHWGTPGWTQRTIDFIVPSTYFTKTSGGVSIPSARINEFVMWMQVWSSQYGGTEQGNAWFADAELYINPSIDGSIAAPMPPTTPATSSSPIIGDSYAITNLNDATLLTADHPSSTNARSAGGQCITGLAGYKLTSGQFALWKIGSPAGTLVAVLYALTGTFGTNGRPTGAALATSNTVAMSSIGGMAFYTFTFPQPYTLSNGHYCIAIQVSSGDSFNGNNCILIGYDNSSPTHAGNYFIYANNAWTGYQSLDGCFSVSFTS